MKKNIAYVAIRSSLALLVSTAILAPAQVWASDNSLHEEGRDLLATPARLKHNPSEERLRSLTNIAAQLQEHARRAEVRVQKVTQIGQQAAQDIADDEGSIDFKALIKTVMPNGTIDALQNIYDSHERIAVAYELETPEVELKKHIQALLRDLENTHEDSAAHKEKVSKVDQLLDEAQKAHQAKLEEFIARQEEEKRDAEVEKQRAVAETAAKLKEEQDAQITLLKQEYDAAVKNIIEDTQQERQAAIQKVVEEKQQELDQINAQKGEVQKDFKVALEQKDLVQQKLVMTTQAVKALFGKFDGKDINNLNENEAKEMLSAIHDALKGLTKADE